MISDYKNLINITTVTIASGATTSGIINLYGTRLVGLILPAAMTGTKITVQGSVDGTNFYTLYTDLGATKTEITFTANAFVALQPSATLPTQYVRFVSGASESAARSLIAVSHPI